MTLGSRVPSLQSEECALESRTTALLIAAAKDGKGILTVFRGKHYRNAEPKNPGSLPHTASFRLP